MNFSGRSVDAASRVIEIDELLEATMASGFRGAQIVEYLALGLFLFDRRLDHEIAVGKTVERVGGRDPLQRLLALVVGDGLLRDLARQIAIDGCHRRLEAIGRNVVENHVHSGESRHMRDAVAHLARPDHADFPDHCRHLVISSELPRVPRSATLA